MSLMKVKVTRRDIDLANKYNKAREQAKELKIGNSRARWCPIACALRRTKRHPAFVAYGTSSIKFPDGSQKSWNNMEDAKILINDFDTGRTVSPQTVTLETR